MRPEPLVPVLREHFYIQHWAKDTGHWTDRYANIPLSEAVNHGWITPQQAATAFSTTRAF